MSAGHRRPRNPHARHPPPRRTLPPRCPSAPTLGLVAAAAMAGLPPLNGFISKEMMLEAALAHDRSPGTPRSIGAAGDARARCSRWPTPCASPSAPVSARSKLRPRRSACARSAARAVGAGCRPGRLLAVAIGLAPQILAATAGAGRRAPPCRRGGHRVPASRSRSGTASRRRWRMSGFAVAGRLRRRCCSGASSTRCAAPCLGRRRQGAVRRGAGGVRRLARRATDGLHDRRARAAVMVARRRHGRSRSPPPRASACPACRRHAADAAGDAGPPSSRWVGLIAARLRRHGLRRIAAGVCSRWSSPASSGSSCRSPSCSSPRRISR